MDDDCMTCGLSVGEYGGALEHALRRAEDKRCRFKGWRVRCEYKGPGGHWYPWASPGVMTLDEARANKRARESHLHRNVRIMRVFRKTKKS
jgi:hypothetical protein